MKKHYIKPYTKSVIFETEPYIICASPNSYQQDMLDKHHNWYWDGEHVRNPGGVDKCGASEYRTNLWD